MEIKYLQVLVMDNGEIICLGKSIGFLTDKSHNGTPLSNYVFTKEEVKDAKE